MNESVYNLIPEPEVEVLRPPRHTSKFKQHVVRLPPPSYTTFPLPGAPAVDGSAATHYKRGGANMGRVVSSDIDPRSFLKRGEGPRYVAESHPTEKIYTKAPIVTAAEKPVMGLRSEKDFVKSNAIEMANMPTRGRKLEEPRPSQRKSFGRVPHYLEAVKSQLAEERTYVEELKKAETARQQEVRESYARQMPEEQRLHLLKQLKERWEEKHHQFLSLPFSRDTMMQVVRKEAVEKDLKEIEAAIARLEKKIVYIYNEQSDAAATAAKLATI
eukprot:CAMPEP_0176461558 /NCGR_PEP_ID=MMETSP0127-20121128/34735_1 /TAXON_ID=938130 /ORGANISM="Platyophrya macrostoma, Strain WH" /LENGTH=271 /DNA_ID=CAMNT_0017853291 /DNA_START=1 /DNA_END=816 /DNA_ORIENTATION=+